MAPVTTTTTAINIHEDGSGHFHEVMNPKYVGLIRRLGSFYHPAPLQEDIYTSNNESTNIQPNPDRDTVMTTTQDYSSSSNHSTGNQVDIEGLVGELERWPKWRFQEQANLYDWIQPLNALDAALTHLIKSYPYLLLIAPHDTPTSTKCNSQTDSNNNSNSSDIHKIINNSHLHQAESEAQVKSVPPSVIHALTTVLRFLCILLKNANNKTIFNSVRELGDLLSAADDTIASLALQALAALASPPPIHRQQTPDFLQHNTMLHTSPLSHGVHTRLLLLATGWGSRASGLGLATCVSTDDSTSGVACLPIKPGEVSLEYVTNQSTDSKRIYLSANDIIVPHNNNSLNQHDYDSDYLATSTSSNFRSPHKQAEKKRKTDVDSTQTIPAPTNMMSSSQTKSTSYLFFKCLEQIGGRTSISQQQTFSLLVHIRLASSFHSRQARVDAVKRRLHALIAMIYSYPTQDILSGYFTANPELVTELTDLIRPMVSPHNLPSAIPTVAASKSKKAALKSKKDDETFLRDQRLSLITNFVDLTSSSSIPYDIRCLAVEALNAIVYKKDSSNSSLSHIARQTNILGELGLGKNQTLGGLLPALIRYSLASMNSFFSESISATASLKSDVSCDENQDSCARDCETLTAPNGNTEDEFDDLGLDLGLSFLEATKPPPLSFQDGMEKALHFIDLVLSLTFSVVSILSGAASLTDCGLIPALINTVSLHVKTQNITKENDDHRCDSYIEDSDESISYDDEPYPKVLHYFITSQAIQILEGAIANHNDAASAFQELHGIDILLSCLSFEIELIKRKRAPSNDTDSDVNMSTNLDQGYYLKPSRKELIFSLLNCVTSFLNQKDVSRSMSLSAPRGGLYLRKPELRQALIDVMDNAKSYGGVVTSLACNLLSEIMNSDPPIVNYVYECGLADAFFRMMGCDKTSKHNEFDSMNPQISFSPELVMSLPAVIAALALTESGTKRLLEVNPIPPLLVILCNPNFVLPHTRSFYHETAAIVGSGLDEIMRHVPRLKVIVMKAIVDTILYVIQIGNRLVNDELLMYEGKMSPSEVEHSRTCFIQYAHSIGQILDNVLQNEDHCKSFVEQKGIQAIFKLYPFLMPTGKQLLTHISSQSSPATACLTHSMAGKALMTSMKKIAGNNDPEKIIKEVITSFQETLEEFEKNHSALRDCIGSKTVIVKSDDTFILESMNVSGILQGIPVKPLHLLENEEITSNMFILLSNFIRSILCIEWKSNILSSIIKVACQRNPDYQNWGGDRGWQKHICSPEFKLFLNKLSSLHTTSVFEFSRIRTDDGYENRELERWKHAGETNCHPSIFKIRIVCPEGAVVRDGIEIDSCLSIGGLEMGEIVYAFDRCINGAGIMRYRTNRGWLSEQARGHGRDPIAEVLSFSGVATKQNLYCENKSASENKGRTECGIADLRSVCASILARQHASHTILFSSLGRIVMWGLRSIPSRFFLSQQGQPSEKIGSLSRSMSDLLKNKFNTLTSSEDILDDNGNPNTMILNRYGASMYYGNMLSILDSCLYEEKREKQILNVMLLSNLLISDGLNDSFYIQKESISDDSKIDLTEPLPNAGFFGVIRFVLQNGLFDIQERSTNTILHTEKPLQSLSRATASSFPIALSILRRLVSQSLSIDPQTSTVFMKMKGDALQKYIVGDSVFQRKKCEGVYLQFQLLRYARSVHNKVGNIALEIWNNPALPSTPAHVLNPLLGLISDVLVSLDDSVMDDSLKQTMGNERNGGTVSRSQPNNTNNSGAMLDLNRNLRTFRTLSMIRPPGPNEEPNLSQSTNPVQPSEATIQVMTEMGFSREQAIDAIETTQSNIPEIAMEYAISHPLSPRSLERRREQREAARQSLSSSFNANQGNENSDSINESNIQNDADKLVSDASKDEKPRALTEEERHQKMEKKADDLVLDRTKDFLDKFRGSINENAVNIIECQSFSMLNVDAWNKKTFSYSNALEEKNVMSRLGAAESTNIVICTFVMNICLRYPDSTAQIIDTLLRRLKSYLNETKEEGNMTKSKENCLASVSHALILFLRAFPEQKTSMLKMNLVTNLLQHVRRFISRFRHSSHDEQKWPDWLPPILLLIESMAQPIVIMNKELKEGDNLDDSTVSGTSSRHAEYARVLTEHKQQEELLSKISKKISLALCSKKESATAKGHKSVDKNSKLNPATLDGSHTDSPPSSKNSVPDKSNTEDSDSTLKFHPYAPLMTKEMADFCLSVCLQLLRLHQCKRFTKKKVETKASAIIPPSVAHATMLLLTRLLRSHKVASRCLKMRGAELVLSLNFSSRFQGHTSLITLALRRMLEDENTLQACMETEIRSIVAKLQKKQGRRVDPSSTSIPSKSFLQAVAPLICRDPIVFLKAAATSIRVESVSTDSPSRQPNVHLLSNDERAKNAKALSECFGNTNIHNSSRKIPVTDEKSTTGGSGTPNHQKQKHGNYKNKSFTPEKSVSGNLNVKQNSTSKKSSKCEKQTKSFNSLVSPVNQITFLLLTSLTKTSEKFERELSTYSPYLHTYDYLEILTDLVLALPSVATAIHRYSPTSKDGDEVNRIFHTLNHAISGCQPPPKNAISYLLHNHLPMPRVMVSEKQIEETESDSVVDNSKLEKSRIRIKISQSTARLLVALIARAGEGRRRVISDIAFSLHCKPAKSGTLYQDERQDAQRDNEMWALQSWGELCMGIASPRSNNITQESNSSLSYEVIKVMLQNGLAHALMNSIQRIHIDHPLASSVAAALIRPLEVLTRANVIDTIQDMIDKEIKKARDSESCRMKDLDKKDKKSIPFSQQTDSSFVDDAMIEDGFDADTAERNAIRNARQADYDGMVEEYEVALSSDDNEDGSDDESDDENDDESMSVDSDEDETVHNDDDEDMDEHDDGSIENSSNSEIDSSVNDDSSSNSSDVEESDESSVSDDDEEMESVVVEEESVSQVDENDEEEDDMNNEEEEEDEDDYLNDENDEMFEEDEESGIIDAEAEGDIDEGWMNIPAPPHQFRNAAISRSRANTFMIEAAEAVIGNILRSGGDIQNLSIHDNIADTLNITFNRDNNSFARLRSMGGLLSNRRDRLRPFSSESNATQSQPVRNMPIVYQNETPDHATSAVSSLYRSTDNTNMEYLFSGPAMGSARVYYDLTGTSPIINEVPASNSQISGLDLQLFPGGPVASTHSRSTLSRHLLLSGVILPPVNSLVSLNYRPNESQNNVLNAQETLESGLNDILASTHGNLVRLSRGSTLTFFERPSLLASGRDPSVWTDDGQPLDSVGTGFGLSFEQILGQTIPSNSHEESTVHAVINAAPSVAVNQPEPAGVASLPTDSSLADNTTGTHVANTSGSVTNTAASNNQDAINNVAASAVEQPSVTEMMPEPTLPLPGTDLGQNSDGIGAANSDSHGDENVAEVGTLESSSVQISTSNTLVCPPGMDLEVFNELPIEMQQEIVEQHQVASSLAAQLDSTSELDPEALAALPEDMRREIIEQEQQERRLREQPPADPSHAQEMDNASFIASLAPDLREEILLTSDDAFINTLPADVIAEVQLLRERASSRHGRHIEEAGNLTSTATAPAGVSLQPSGITSNPATGSTSSNKKQRTGRVKVECNHHITISHQSDSDHDFGPLVDSSSLKSLLLMLHLLSPIRPQKLLNKLLQNLCGDPVCRRVLLTGLIALLNDDIHHVQKIVYSIDNSSHKIDEKDVPFLPNQLVGAIPEIIQSDDNGHFFLKKKASPIAASSIAMNLQAKGFVEVSKRIIGALTYLSKSSSKVISDYSKIAVDASRTSLDLLNNFEDYHNHSFHFLDSLVGLIGKPLFSMSSSNLDDLLSLIQNVCYPLSALPAPNDDNNDIPKKEVESSGKEWVDVPHVLISKQRLQTLCSVLTLESCKDVSFGRVLSVASCLCRVAENRSFILRELANVAQRLGVDAIRDLKSLSVRLQVVMTQYNKYIEQNRTSDEAVSKINSTNSPVSNLLNGSPSSAVTLSTSTSELKLLRVLQVLQSIRNETCSLDTDGINSFIEMINLESLWEQLNSCLRVVSILEGVVSSDGKNDKGDGEEVDDSIIDGKKLHNSLAGLLTRFLPVIESFFVVNASFVTKSKNDMTSIDCDEKLITFVSTNKILLNALLRSNPGLLEKGLRAMVRMPRCRPYLDFDVKRFWFKTQLRRLRQHATRRHGSLRLNIRRQHVFEDAYHQLRIRDAEEMRGRLHITFTDEEGVDAGGLSREFFAILAKEIFNPNYALFTSTEDGCTFQPNPNSSINPEHLSYFRFVGRIVGKAVVDGFLLDAHFTRSLYKHMLGAKPTHHDMQAIDPDYYKNLKMILEYNLGDIGLDLTFSTEVHSFGRSRTIDLIPNGRNIKVTEENKEKYVKLVCHHRMTSSIDKQIKAYLDGFYELIRPDLISIFNAKELELLISGMPDIDVFDLKNNTEYHGYKSSDKEIIWFWNIMLSLSKSEKAEFLQFVTGSSKVPLAGFAELQGMRGVQKFSIHKSGKKGALMSAHTCFNALDLPLYDSESEMKEKLLYAIQEGSGGFLFA